MSPRAACRLESLGFDPVYDYVPGKADWMAAGLPTEGAHAGAPRAAAVARDDVPRCRLEETVADVAERIGEWEMAVVVGNEDVVLGVVHRQAIDTGSAQSIATVMEEGPTTFRPDVVAAELGAHLRERGVSRVLVTTSDGVLVGLLRADDVVV